MATKPKLRTMPRSVPTALDIVDMGSLVGPRALSGVDREQVQVKSDYSEGFEDASAIRFVLDGVTYVAVEDPNDGYRSSLAYLIIDKDGPPVANVFAPVPVIGRMRKSSRDPTSYSIECDILEFVLAGNRKVLVLSVGTDNTDDYYPSFERFFDPTALGKVPVPVEPAGPPGAKGRAYYLDDD